MTNRKHERVRPHGGAARIEARPRAAARVTFDQRVSEGRGRPRGVGRGRLRVCVVGSASLPIPPFDGYGGTQRGIHDLVEELRRLGHHVTLCGPGDSTTRVDELIAPLPRALWTPDSPYTLEERERLAEEHVSQVCEAILRRDFDVINVRYDHPRLLETLCQRARVPVVYSLHNVADARTRPLAERLAGRVFLTAHCHAHAAQYGDLPIDVVFYGMDVEAYPFSPKPLTESEEAPTLPLLQELRREGRDYLVVLGRIAAEKGQRSAIEIARRAGFTLIIAGEPFARDPRGAAYFEREVAPLVDGREVHAFGRANELEKRELLRFASGLLFTTGLERPEWREPFGRVIMESLACGTPVIAHAHGSAPELLAPGPGEAPAGVLCRDLDEMVDAACTRMRSLDRVACRRLAERRFSRRRMALECDALFRRAIGSWQKKRQLRPAA